MTNAPSTPRLRSTRGRHVVGSIAHHTAQNDHQPSVASARARTDAAGDPHRDARFDAAVVVPVPPRIAPRSVFVIASRDHVPHAFWSDADDDLCGQGIPANGGPIPWWLGDLSERIRAYFDGRAVDFGDVPLGRDPWVMRESGAPYAADRSAAAPSLSDLPFVQRCWHACRRIPRGRTITYRDLAVAAGGSPRAARAAGQAMRRNPLPIITPCHRVVGTNWTGGYGGAVQRDSDGLARKLGLLALEGVAVSKSR